MSQYLTPFAIKSGSDYQMVISLPLAVGHRKVALRVCGKFFACPSQLYSQLQCVDGLEAANVVATGCLVQNSFNGPLGGTAVEQDINPAPNVDGEVFMAALDLEFDVTTSGTLQYAATLLQTTPGAAVELQVALYEV